MREKLTRIHRRVVMGGPYACREGGVEFTEVSAADLEPSEPGPPPRCPKCGRVPGVTFIEVVKPLGVRHGR